MRNKENDNDNKAVLLTAADGKQSASADGYNANTETADMILRHACFQMPILPLRGVAVLPHSVVQLDVGRDKSIRAINEAMECEGKEIILAMQKDIHVDEPTFDDIHHIGTIATIKQVMRPTGGTMRIIVEGLYRTEILRLSEEKDYFLGEAIQLEMPGQYQISLEGEVYARKVVKEFENFASLAKKVSAEIVATVLSLEDYSALADVAAAQVLTKLSDKQKFLETVDVEERLKNLLSLMAREVDILDLERKIGNEVRKQMEKNQKEYYLREQIRAINKELGEDESKDDECRDYRDKVKAAGMPKEAEEKTLREIDRLQKTPSMAAETSVLRSYIDWMLDIPWSHRTEDRLDLKRAEAILNEDHYGLEEVKDRILEYLAVCQLAQDIKGPILCLTGPPGVGKTSLARSVARALDRNFVRMSLGGMKDEAEIRGHRRTYVGSMPGRILQNMKTAGSVNPVFLLDEVDKLGSDYKGDPSSALLEVLDPEQNSTFADHFIEVPYDLSKVLFITTANVKSNIPRPLLDRMEVIDISGYTEEEKVHIAKDHLLKKELKNHCISEKQLKISDGALRMLIREYTREAGVRSLDRVLAKLCRVAARKLVTEEVASISITVRNLHDYLGKPKFIKEKAAGKNLVGVVNGLAWTEVGGEILQVEVQSLPGSGKIQLTGQLGDVMKESAQAALTYVRSIGKSLGLKAHFEEKIDLHIHVPEGAVPKDGPSAGVTMVTAIASRLGNRKVRGDIAMTGEVTLSGRVLPIGGVKEKVLAAYAAGITTVLMPKENERDLDKIPEEVREKMTFHFCSHVDEVLKIALVEKNV
ncbi:MAG: endopeptidase La [Clostridia bacterium]